MTSVSQCVHLNWSKNKNKNKKSKYVKKRSVKSYQNKTNEKSSHCGLVFTYKHTLTIHISCILSVTVSYHTNNINADKKTRTLNEIKTWWRNEQNRTQLIEIKATYIVEIDLNCSRNVEINGELCCGIHLLRVLSVNRLLSSMSCHWIWSHALKTTIFISFHFMSFEFYLELVRIYWTIPLCIPYSHLSFHSFYGEHTLEFITSIRIHTSAYNSSILCMFMSLCQFDTATERERHQCIGGGRFYFSSHFYACLKCVCVFHIKKIFSSSSFRFVFLPFYCYR